MFKRFGFGALAAISLGMFGAQVIPVVPVAPLPIPRRRVQHAYGGGRSKTTFHPQHGQRERERRMRQIYSGALRHQNGLDIDVCLGPALTRRQRRIAEKYANVNEVWNTPTERW